MIGVCGGEEIEEGWRGKSLYCCVDERKWERGKGIHGGCERESGGMKKL